MANMKQNLTCSRSKPPPARSSSYSLGRVRGQMNVDHPSSALLHTTQVQESHKVAGDKAGSGASGFGDKTSSITSMTASPKEISECLSGWLTYLQMLTGLCGAGSRLSHCLGTLVQDTSSPCHAVATQCQATWEELVKATTNASTVVKAQVIPSLQEVNNASDIDTDSQKLHEHNQVICASLMTFINLHYQFCVACCDFLGAMANSNCCQMNEATPARHNSECIVGIVQQCFAQPAPPPPPPVGTHHSVRSPLHFPLCSLQGPQRRWSEAAAGEVSGETNDGTMRRWSMPWESSRLADHHSTWHGRLNPPSKLAVPSASSQDRSRSTTPDSVWHSSLASQEELQEVIQLLSCRPGVSHSTQLYHPSQHLPECGGWSENVQSDERGGSCGPSRRGSSSPQPLAVQQHLHRASWHAPDTHSHMWGEHEGHIGGERSFDLYPPALDAGTLASRKSSSSTDSSSSHSLHSRSTTGSEGGAEVRAHLYSMWSGSDLTFMKLPESNEPTDTIQAADISTSTSISINSGDGLQRFSQPDMTNTYYSSSK
ncbi:uncharacterized protein LOC110833141 isoform X2 [Zootermopsis nevadensis]|uniref:uncharacterized protein LOC110833141 isoform X2 n=1 Tax=Zootermopsis nevadensis TaxID=136037 RepID=UPI000B8E331D|nr:uncharacterized protein LOC110833141 isoform X2 [Zootermopsis nevadensis]